MYVCMWGLVVCQLAWLLGNYSYSNLPRIKNVLNQFDNYYLSLVLSGLSGIPVTVWCSVVSLVAR